MPAGTTKEQARQAREFNETIARKAADAAKREDEGRFEHTKQRRETMVDDFNTQRTRRAREAEASKRRHDDDLKRFAELKQKDADLKAAEAAKKERRAQAAEERDRKDARRGAEQLEATLRRLGVDTGDAAVASHGPVVNTTIAGQTGTERRAPRDLIGGDVTEQERERERQAQNDAVIAKIRSRRVEDSEARRDKEKRQWRMEAELARSAADMAARNERSAWLERARQLAPSERQRAFSALKQTVAFAAEGKRIEATNEGLRSIAARRAADADAKFAVTAREQHVETQRGFTEEHEQALVGVRAQQAVKHEEKSAFCRALATGICELAFDVLSYNQAKVQAGTAASVLEPLPTSTWREAVQKRIGDASSAPIVRPPSSSGGSRLGGTSRNPLLMLSGTSHERRRSRASTPNVAGTVMSPTTKSAAGSGQHLLPTNAAATTSVPTGPGGLNAETAASLATEFLQDVAELDAKGVADEVSRAAATALGDEHRAELAEQANSVAATPLAACALLGTEGGRLASVFEATVNASWSDEARANFRFRVVSKESVEASCAAARAAAEAQADATAAAEKSMKGGGKSKAPGKAPSKSTMSADVVSSDAESVGTPRPSYTSATEALAAMIVSNVTTESLSAPPSNAPTPQTLTAEATAPPEDSGSSATPAAQTPAASVLDEVKPAEDRRPMLIVGFTEAELAEAFDGFSPGLMASVAVVVVDLTRGERAHRLIAAAPNKRLVDPAAIFRAVDETVRADASVGEQVFDAVGGQSALVRRLAAHVLIEAKGHNTFGATDSEIANAVLQVVSNPEVDVRPLELRDTAVASDLAAEVDELAIPEAVVKQSFEEMRSFEVELATALRSSIRGIMSVLEASNLPPQPPATASADLQHDFWVASDRVRTMATRNVSEIVGECRGAFIDLSASRLAIGCDILSSTAAAIFGSALSGAVPTPTEEQCKAHVASTIAEFALLPSDTDGAAAQQRNAVKSMLTELIAAINRSVEDGADGMAHSATEMYNNNNSADADGTREAPAKAANPPPSPPLDKSVLERRRAIWAALAPRLVDVLVAHYDAVAWWHSDMSTAAAIWLQGRLVAEGSRFPASQAEFLDAASVHRVDRGRFDEHEVRVTPGGVSSLVVALVPTGDALRAQPLTPFSARHMRLHQAVALDDVRHALLSAQVACLSVNGDGSSSSATTGSSEGGDTLFLPARSWWFEPYAAPQAPASSIAGGPVSPTDTGAGASSVARAGGGDRGSSAGGAGAQSATPAGGASASRQQQATPAASQQQPSASRPESRASRARTPVRGGKRPTSTSRNSQDRPSATPDVESPNPVTVDGAPPASTTSARPPQPLPQLAEAVPDQPALPASLGLLAPAAAASVLSGMCYPASDDVRAFVAAAASGRCARRASGENGAPAPPPSAPMTVIKAVATAIGTATGVTDVGVFIESGIVEYDVFRSLPCWAAAGLTHCAVRALWEAFGVLAEDAPYRGAQGVPARSLLNFLVGDSKSEAKVLEGLFTFCATLGMLSGDPLKKMARPDELPWTVFAVVVPHVAAEDMAAASLFAAAGASHGFVSLKSGLMGAWGRASLAAAKQRGLRLPGLCAVAWPQQYNNAV